LGADLERRDWQETLKIKANWQPLPIFQKKNIKKQKENGMKIGSELFCGERGL
jgi:hypothetical protein